MQEKDIKERREKMKRYLRVHGLLPSWETEEKKTRADNELIKNNKAV